MTEEMETLVLGYLTQIDRKLDMLMDELVQARRSEKLEGMAELSSSRYKRVDDLLDRFAALSPEEQKAQIDRANEFLRQRMAEQPGVPLIDLDISERPKH